jgi:hypothetical protein
MVVVLVGGFRLGGRWVYAFPIYLFAVLVAGLLYAPQRIDNPDGTIPRVRVIYVLLAVSGAASIVLLLIGEVALGALALAGAAFALVALIRVHRRLRRFSAKPS